MTDPADRAHAVPLAAVTVAAGILCLACVAWIDRPLADVLKAEGGGVTQSIFAMVTNLGNGWFYFPPALALMAWGKLARRPAFSLPAATVFVTMAGSGLTEIVIKYVLGRNRPRLWFDNGAFALHPFSHGWALNSFPSGHSQTIFAAMTALALLFPRTWPVCMAVAVLVAASRVILTVHWASDAVGGAWLGLFWAVLVVRAYPRSDARRS